MEFSDREKRNQRSTDHDPRSATAEEFLALDSGSWLKAAGGIESIGRFRALAVYEMDIGCLGPGVADWWTDLTRGSIASHSFEIQRLGGRNLPILRFELSESAEQHTSIRETDGHRHITKELTKASPQNFFRVYTSELRFAQALTEEGVEVLHLRDTFFRNIILSVAPLSGQTLHRLIHSR